MILSVNHAPYPIVPIQVFRDRHQLPASFGIPLFVTKDWTGLARIDQAGEALQTLRQTILDAVPVGQPTHGWMGFALTLQLLFRSALQSVNDTIGLKPSEITFAANGFGTVCQIIVTESLKARMSSRAFPEFGELYQRWLSSTILLSGAVYSYRHAGEDWKIQIVQHAYGRAGMMIDTADTRCYVHDPALACPAEGYMMTLLRDVAERIQTAMRGVSQDA